MYWLMSMVRAAAMASAPMATVRIRRSHRGRHVLDRDRGRVDVGEALVGLPEHQHGESGGAQRHREEQVEDLVRVLLHLAERHDAEQQAGDLGGAVAEEAAGEGRPRRSWNAASSRRPAAPRRWSARPPRPRPARIRSRSPSMLGTGLRSSADGQHHQRDHHQHRHVLAQHPDRAQRPDGQRGGDARRPPARTAQRGRWPPVSASRPAEITSSSNTAQPRHCAMFSTVGSERGLRAEQAAQQHHGRRAGPGAQHQRGAQDHAAEHRADHDRGDRGRQAQRLGADTASGSTGRRRNRAG